MNKKCVRVIFFDLGGVFFHWDQAFSTAAKEFGVDIDDLIKVLNDNVDQFTRGHITTKHFWQMCRKQLMIRGGESYDFLDNWAGDYVPIKETAELALRLKEDFKIGIISNIYEGMFPKLIEKGIIPSITYDYVLLSYELHIKKT